VCVCAECACKGDQAAWHYIALEEVCVCVCVFVGVVLSCHEMCVCCACVCAVCVLCVRAKAAARRDRKFPLRGVWGGDD